MADRLTVGKAFLADLLARVPEEHRASVEAGLVASEEAVALLGDGTMRQSEFSRELNRLQEVERQQTAWYATNKAALEAATRGGADPGTPAPTPAPDLVSRAEMQKTLDQREEGVATYMAATTGLVMKHYKEFGETLDVTELLGDPEVRKIGILGVYDRKFAPKYAEKAKAATDAHIAAEVAKGVAEARKTFTSAPPYPVGPTDLSPLDVLEPNKGSDQHSAQAAADEYTRLVQAKQMAGATP